MNALLNGQIYYDRDDKHCVIVQWLAEDTWILLGGPEPALHGGTCMRPVLDQMSVFYTKAELQKKLKDEEWQYTRARLIVEDATLCDGKSGPPSLETVDPNLVDYMEFARRDNWATSDWIDWLSGR